MKVATLDEVCYLNMGQSPDSSTYNEVGDGLPFYQGNADFGEKHPQCRVWCSEPTKIAEKEDILISVRAPIGALNEANERCCIGRGLAAIRPKEKINKDFLYYFLQSKKSYLISKGTGSTFKAISKNVLRELSIPVPTLHEQEKRARILNTLWRVIYTRRAQLAKLDELVKCRFVELFGDAKNNPYGWVSETVDSVVEEIIGGVSVSGEARKIQKGELAVLKVSAVTYGVFKCDEYKVISNDIKLGKYVSPKKGDLLFSRANTKELVGATALVDKDYPHLLLPDKIWKIVVSDKVSPVYLKAYLSEPWIRELMSKVATGTSGSMYNISMEKLRQIPVILPPIERQNVFSTFVRRVDKLRFIVEDNLSFPSLVGAFCIVEVGDKSE